MFVSQLSCTEHTSGAPFGPWQTLGALRLTFCMVWPTFCMVGPIFLYSMASILSNVPEILHVQHQFFEIFVLEFGLVAKKLFRVGGGSEPKVIKITFLTLPLIVTDQLTFIPKI